MPSQRRWRKSAPNVRPMALTSKNLVRADRSSTPKIGIRYQVSVAIADIYNWFTEGFDTADLKDAKALLDELGEGH